MALYISVKKKNVINYIFCSSEKIQEGYFNHTLKLNKFGEKWNSLAMKVGSISKCSKESNEESIYHKNKNQLQPHKWKEIKEYQQTTKILGINISYDM